MSQQEINTALDALEAEQVNLDEPNKDQVVPDENQVTLDEEAVKDEPKEKPPGFLSYDEWVEKGKDPADYKGENAYSAEYDRIKENRELKDTMRQVVNSVGDLKKQYEESSAQQVEQARVDLRAELEKAKEDDDTEAALSAQKRLLKLDKEPAQVQVNPIISDFTIKNPIIDPNNAQYNEEFHQDMIMIHNGKLDQLLGGDRTRAGELTQSQIERVQKLAFSQAKELHADKFVSSRNTRRSPAKPSQRTAQSVSNVSAQLKAFTGNSRNPRDAAPANDLYEALRARDPEAAEVFAKNLIGE